METIRLDEATFAVVRNAVQMAVRETRRLHQQLDRVRRALDALLCTPGEIAGKRSILHAEAERRGEHGSAAEQHQRADPERALHGDAAAGAPERAPRASSTRVGRAADTAIPSDVPGRRHDQACSRQRPSAVVKARSNRP